MVKKLNKEAIDEITYLLDEVKDVVRLLKEFEIHIDSDCWSATTPTNHDYENILAWNRKDFETLDVSDIKSFNIGGNLVTGSEHQYKKEWIIAPKDLAEVQGDIFERYLVSIMNSVSLKHFKLRLDEPFGLVNNCGWEYYLVIEATIQESAIIDSDAETKKLVEEIMKEDMMCLDWHEYHEEEPYFVDKEEIEQIFNNAINQGDEIKANKLTENRYEVTFNGDILYFVCPFFAREQVIKDWKELKWLFKEYE